MAINTQKLIVELSADVDKYNKDMSGALKDTNRNASKATKSLVKVNDAAGQLNKIGGRALLTFAGIAASAFSVAKIQKYADEYTNLQNRIRTVIGPTQDLGVVTGQLLSLANETRSSLESTSILYSRLRRNTQDLALSDQELLDVTRTINQSFAVSGASATEAAAAIVQLSQGLAAGTLRGDEFNSVAEQAPVILEAVAAATGKSRGELRALAADGKISADVLISSLKAYSEVIDSDFSKANMTAAQAQTELNNNFIVFVGELDKATGFSASAVGSIKDLSDALEATQQPLINVIESIKDFAGVIENNLSKSGDDLSALADQYETELKFMGELVGAFAFIVETGMLSVPVIIQSAVTVAIASIATLIDEGRVKILEFRRWVADLRGQEDVVAIIDQQIAAIGSGAADTLDAVIETTKEKLSGLRDAVAENDAAMAAERKERRDAQTEEELAALEERLVKEAEIKARFEEEGRGSVELAGPKKTTKQEEAEAKKQLQITRNLEDSKTKVREAGSSLAVQIMSGLSRNSEKAAMATFLVSQGLAASNLFMATQAASMRALQDLGPLAGAPVAAAIETKGAIGLASIAATTLFGATGSGGAGGAVGGAAGNAGQFGGPGTDGGPTLTTGERESQSIDVSLSTTAGSTTSNIMLTAPAGDSVGEMFAEWINKGIREGRIG